MADARGGVKSIFVGQLKGPTLEARRNLENHREA